MDLTELIDSIDDITDPTAIENILMYVDYVEAQDEEFIELLMQKLPFMEITWEQPWYQQSKSLTRRTVAVGDIKEHYRTDKITVKEIKRIHKNWRKFRKHFGIPDKPESFARWKNTCKSRNPQTPEECVRRYVIAYLARGLERSLNQVYKHVVIHYGSQSKGFYSLEEEKLMEVCFYHNVKNPIPLLSKVLGRDARGIYKKLQEWLNGKEDRKRIQWKLPQATKLLKLLIEVSGLPLEKLKNQKFDRSIWLKLEKQFNHPYIYLQHFWWSKLHVQIFVNKDIKIKKIRKKIARKLQESSYRTWRDIRWKELVKEFPDGFTDIFLYRVWINIFRNHKEFSKLPINELVEYALQRIHSYKDRRLRRLQLDSSGNLIEVQYHRHHQPLDGHCNGHMSPLSISANNESK